jgi:hypothetical protein
MELRIMPCRGGATRTYGWGADDEAWTARAQCESTYGPGGRALIRFIVAGAWRLRAGSPQGRDTSTTERGRL